MRIMRHKPSIQRKTCSPYPFGNRGNLFAHGFRPSFYVSERVRCAASSRFRGSLVGGSGPPPSNALASASLVGDPHVHTLDAWSQTCCLTVILMVLNGFDPVFNGIPVRHAVSHGFRALRMARTSACSSRAPSRPGSSKECRRLTPPRADPRRQGHLAGSPCESLFRASRSAEILYGQALRPCWTGTYWPTTPATCPLLVASCCWTPAVSQPRPRSQAKAAGHRSRRESDFKRTRTENIYNI